MKKWIALFMIALMLFSFTACGEEDTDGDDASSQKPTSSTNSKPSSSTPDKPVGNLTVNDVTNYAPSAEGDFVCADNGKGGLILIRYKGNGGVVVIPETINGKPIVEITQLVFNQKNVRAVKLSDSVEKIGKGCFMNNPDLQIVICGKGLKTIGESAFQGNAALTDVVLNEGLETMDFYCFSHMEALKSIYIPGSVTTIKDALFGSVRSLTIYGKSGSAAEQYANAEGFTFTAK